MTLIDLYVAEVGKRLPMRTRTDIENELRSTLQDMLEDRSQKAGRPVDDEMVKAFEHASGKPIPYVIGPRREGDRYECTEHTLSRFLPNQEAYRVLQQLKIDSPALQVRLSRTLVEGISRLLARQGADGGAAGSRQLCRLSRKLRVWAGIPTVTSVGSYSTRTFTADGVGRRSHVAPPTHQEVSPMTCSKRLSLAAVICGIVMLSLSSSSVAMTSTSSNVHDWLFDTSGSSVVNTQSEAVTVAYSATNASIGSRLPCTSTPTKPPDSSTRCSRRPGSRAR